VHKLSHESATVSKSAVNDWYLVLAEILKKYAPREVYNADESALYYNLLPDKILAVKDDPRKGGKQNKECLTLLLCANMDGSDKVKPFVIGKSANPRAFRGVRSILATCKSNRKAWMTPELKLRIFWDLLPCS
jgi:hypothetical protein